MDPQKFNIRTFNFILDFPKRTSTGVVLEKNFHYHRFTYTLTCLCLWVGLELMVSTINKGGLMSEQKLPYGLEPIPKKVQAEYTNITWEKLIQQINDYLPKGWVAGWDFTGGGCSAIIINQKDDMNYEHKSHIRLTDIDVPSVSDYQKEVDINFFTLGIHDAGNPSENWWSEDGKFHELVVQGYEGSEYDFLDLIM